MTTMNIPRRDCRGSVEAQNWLGAHIAYTSFRGVIVAAPLKRQIGDRVARSDIAFRGVIVAAPLKPATQLTARQVGEDIPRRDCRGSVEASLDRRDEKTDGQHSATRSSRLR